MKRMQCDRKKRKKRKKYKPRSISKTDATTKMNKNPFLAIVLSYSHCCEESEATSSCFLAFRIRQKQRYLFICVGSRM
jgi:hypothetical protein